jgi:branched-chain amino acid transport system substrate-binding protein
MRTPLLANAARTLAVTATALAAALAAQHAAAAENQVTIGFITDMSGLYADIDGKGGATAIQMAIDDFGGKVNGLPIKLITQDHQNKADIAASTARKWIDTEGLDMLIGGTNSATGLSMNDVIKEKKRPYFSIGAGTDALTNKACTPYTIHYAYDTTALAKGTGSAIVKQGLKTWYFLTADYAFGKSLDANTTKVVEENGGKVLGRSLHPLSASDFSSFLKAAKEFGIGKTMKVAALLMFIDDVHSVGLPTAQGLLLTDSWYWDQNDKARAWAQKYFKKTGKMPSSLQAADYSATMDYLNAVKAVGSTDPDKVMAQLHKQPIDDFYAKGHVREDGSMIHDMYLYQVKTPAESKKPWDYYMLKATIPGDQAFTDKKDSQCDLWK